MRVFGRLRTRLVLAFSLVSLASIIVLAFAAQYAVDRGIQATFASVDATPIADLAAQAYRDSGEWSAADLEALSEAAAKQGAVIELDDASGATIWSSGSGRGRPVTVPVTVDGATVGEVTVRSIRPSESDPDRGLQVAWGWIVAAALGSLTLAVVAGWWVTRWLTRPLARLAEVAYEFAGGKLAVRASESGADEIVTVARGFNDAADAVERSTNARRQMAADVAHELRTPLAALQAGLEELTDGLVEPDAATLARLHAQSVRLGRVVADLGLLAHSDAAPQLRTRQVDLAQVAADEAQARVPELRAAGIELRTDLTGVMVLADSDRLHQVVGNILANCARHCRAGDHVQLIAHPDGDHAVLEVIDDGPGIPAEVLPKVFDRYVRGDAAIPGSGLGLAVVREIVEAHQGTVEASSTSGTKVVVRLPAAHPEQQSVIR